MKKVILTALVTLAFMEGIAWYVFKIGQDTEAPKETAVVDSAPSEPTSPEKTSEPEITASQEIKPSSPTPTEVLNEYPKITTEVVNGRTERTIHMGVRKWVWEPLTVQSRRMFVSYLLVRGR